MTTILDYLEHWTSVFHAKFLSVFLNGDGTTQSAHTYCEFLRRTRNLAVHLAHNSELRYGDRALLAYPPGLEMITAFFACARLGIIPVPVPAPTSVRFESGQERMAFIARDCGAKVAITTKAFLRSYQQLLARRETASRRHSTAPR